MCQELLARELAEAANEKNAAMAEQNKPIGILADGCPVHTGHNPAIVFEREPSLEHRCPDVVRSVPRHGETLEQQH